MYNCLMIELVASARTKSAQLPIYPLYLGQEQCEPLHQYGRIRPNYLIHYVLAGSGEFHTPALRTKLGEGEAFLVLPGQEHWYQADRVDPWEYCWVGFQGPSQGVLSSWFDRQSIPGIMEVHPSRRDPFHHAFRQLWSVLAEEQRRSPPIELTQALLAVLRLLFAEERRGHRSAQDEHFRGAARSAEPEDGDGARERNRKDGPQEARWARILAFIDAHYAEPITVQTLCRGVGVSRAELHRLCVRHTGHSVKKELTRRRMDRAALLLKDGDRPISRIAALTGYVEYQTFERQFRRYYGRTPGEFRGSGTPHHRWGNQ